MKSFMALLSLVAVSASALACPETLNFRKRVLAGDEEVKLCAHKYLLDRKGRLVGSYSSEVRPENRQLVTAIEAAL